MRRRLILKIFIPDATPSFRMLINEAEHLTRWERILFILSLAWWNVCQPKLVCPEYHCARATTISNLFQAGVDANNIRAFTQHQAERSLYHYICGTTNDQKREFADILAHAFTNDLKAKSMSSTNNVELDVGKSSGLSLTSVMSNFTVNVFNGFHYTQHAAERNEQVFKCHW